MPGPCGGPRALKSLELRELRLSRIQEPHVAPLQTLIDQLRATRARPSDVPTFDPCDGGIDAEILLLLEAPGPRAVETGFISINNPDGTAANLYGLLEEAGIDRGQILMWNVVPWYLGNKDRSKIRPATCKDIVAASPHLAALVRVLHNLKACVLFGKKAQAAEPLLRAIADIPIIPSPHPSPVALGTDSRRRSLAIEALQEAVVAA